MAGKEPADSPQRTTHERAQALEVAFVAACKRAREERGWSQRELSRRAADFGLHLAQSSIAKMEATGGERRPVTIAEALVLSRVLGLNLGQYLLGSGSPQDVQEQITRLYAYNDFLSDYLLKLLELPAQMVEWHAEIQRRLNAEREHLGFDPLQGPLPALHADAYPEHAPTPVPWPVSWEQDAERSSTSDEGGDRG